MGEYNGVVGGVSNIVAVDFKPWWEGIQGTVTVDHATGHLSPREAYERVLNWQVLERPIFVDIGINDEGQTLFTVPGKKALIRDDTRSVLGVHSSEYGPVQNETLCEFMEALKIVGDDVQIVSAGELFGGPVVWMLAKLGEDKHFLGGDERIARYFAVSSSHDGSLAFGCKPTDTRIECMNTFSAHLGGGWDIKLRHTSNVQDHLVVAKKTLDGLYAHSEELDREIEELLSTPFSPAEFKSVVMADINPEPEPLKGETKVSPLRLTNWETRRDALLKSYNRADQQNIIGTAWGAVMGVNSYENWEQRIKVHSRATTQAVKALRGNYPLTQRTRELVTA